MHGRIYTYRKEKGIGAIVCGTDRYWFHRDRIVKGPIDPELNDEVIFEVTGKPVAPGRLPIATAIIILERVEQSAGANSLAGQNSPTEAK